MDKNKLVTKVLSKLSLPPDVKAKMSSLIRGLKEVESAKIAGLLNSFKEQFKLSDAQFGEVMNQVVDAKVFMSDSKTVDPSKLKELKSITDHPPIKIYFDRTY